MKTNNPTDQLTEELKACPFCEGKAFIESMKNKFDCLEGSISCDCGVRGMDFEGDSFSTDKEAIQEAIKAWNTRTPDPRDQLMQDMAEALEEIASVEIQNSIGGLWSKVEGWEYTDTGEKIYEARLPLREIARFRQALTAYNEFKGGT